MTKESKTCTTIRRRKGKQVALAMQKVREENEPSKCFASEEDQNAAEKQDKCYLFDNRVLGPIFLRQLMSRDRSLFLSLLAIRCANALLLQTQYVPDEFWQSLEIAHKMIFGYGYESWEWREGIRGYTHPFMFAVIYKIVQILNLDSRLVLIKLPKLVQGGLAAWGDYRLYKLSLSLCGRSTAQWTLLCQVVSWFTMYCCTRTLSNSTETVFVVAALSYFPFPDGKKEYINVHKFLFYASMSVITRPTAALIWILVCSWHLQRVYKNPNFSKLVWSYLVVGGLSLSVSAVIDRIWYGKWTFVQWNFLMFNVIRGGASIYGTHPWHWYITQGFPVVLGFHIIPFLLGAWKATNKSLLWVIVWIVGTHSFLPHKEFRFIMPALPLCIHYCGVYFQQLCKRPNSRKFKQQAESKESTTTNVSEESEEEEEVEEISLDKDDKNKSKIKEKLQSKKEEFSEEKFEQDQNKECKDKLVEHKDDSKSDSIKSEERLSQPKPRSAATRREEAHSSNLKRAKIYIITLAILNTFPALYFCLIHQRGTIAVTRFLHDESRRIPGMDVLFLMPCHSTPYFSYIHRNITMRFLTCEPNLKGLANYTEEADMFYQNPKRWLNQEYSSSKKRWPTHMVFFNNVLKEISSVLTQSSYKLCTSYFHTHFPEGRVGHSVVVACR